MITIDELKAKLGGMKTAVDDLRDALSIEASEKRLAELEHQMTMPGFYDDQARSQKVISEMGEVKNKLERFGKLSTQYEEAETLLLMIEEENDPSLAAEGEEAVNGVEKSIDELQLMTMLNGEYDHNNAILTFHAGTGGTEAQDWAEMLYRMYNKWAQAHGMTVEVLPDHPLEAVCAAIAEAVGLVGVVNMEFIRHGDDFFFLEVNPRFSGGVGFSMAAGMDFAEMMLCCHSCGSVEAFPAAPKHALLARESTIVLTQLR